jgi:hypothetical protein
MTKRKCDFLTTPYTSIDSRVWGILPWMMNFVESTVCALRKQLGVFVECHMAMLLKNGALYGAPNARR